MLPRRISICVFTYLLLLSSLTASTPASAQTLHPADYAGLLLVLSQLKANLDSVTNTLDQESAARINQIKIALDGVIKEINDTVNNTADKTQITETKIFSDVDDVMERTNTELQNKGYLAYVGVNNTLVSLANVLSGIPFYKAKPYLFATMPLRLNPDASDRLVSFYGYFPDLDSSHPATVMVELEGVGKKQVTLNKYVGNQLSFVMPGEYVKEGKFVEMTVTLPVLKYYVWHTTDDTHARIYIEQRNTFSFNGTAYQENPAALWATVPAPSALHERADSGQTTNAQTLTAPALFSQLVNDNIKYDMATASFISVGSTSSASGPPCHCGCNGGSVGPVTYDANNVSYSLAAPSCGAHMCSMFDSCGGGGTNADVYLTPTFKVKNRGVPETTVLGARAFRAARRSVVPDIDLGPNSSVVTIVGTFQDQDERYQSEVTLTRGVPVANSDLWRVPS